MMIGEDLTGKRYGLLSVIYKTKQNDGRAYYWKCVCECGNEKLATSGNLKHGLVKSCGCLRKLTNIKHGDSYKRIRHIWNRMMAVCYKENHKQYKYYGGRGIDVCLEWHEYDKFKEWAYANGYSEELTIDRYPNNDKGYYPNNVRWATYKQQNNNKRSNRFITINGETKTVSEFAEISGISQMRVVRRLNLGWNAYDAVFKQTDKNKINKRFRDVNRTH